MNAPTSRIPGLALAALALACLGACQGPRNITMVEKSGDRAVFRGDYQRASADYAELVERKPDYFEGLKKYGKALLETDRPRLAREQLEKAYTLEPADGETIELLAQAMLESGDADSAIRMLRDLALDQGTPESWMRLGEALQFILDFDGAETAFLTAARGDLGQSVEPQLALARLYKQAGNPDMALERLSMVMYLDPENAEAIQMVREFGEIPGPTFATRPTEQYAAPTGYNPTRTTEVDPERD